MKKIVAGILAFSLILGGIYFVAPEASEAQAETTEESAEQVVYTTETYMEDANGTVQGYIDGKDVMETTTNPGWLFAGWFTDEDCTTPVSTTVEGTTYHAKFVDPGVLSVKLQITQDTTAESKTTNMRLVSSVDSLDYAQVGFEVYYDTAIGTETPTQNIPIYTVYERIVASSESGVEYNYSPKVVDTDSEYFVTATLIDIASGNFEKPFHIKPYWITLNGARVYGTSRYVTITDDALSTTTVNVPVKIVGTKGSTDGSAYTVTEDTTAKMIYHDGTYAHFRMAAPTVSLTKYNITATTEDGTETAVAYHRNLETVYNATDDDNKNIAYTATASDKTWYTVYKDTEGVVEETEFVIATTADLYALPDIVNSDGETFNGKTIYVVADIVANHGTAGTNSWTPASTDSSSYYWSPVGNEDTNFQGTFDGCGHAIEGIYTNSGLAFCGLFGYTNDAKIQNLSLKNSLLKTSSASGCAGSIVGRGDATLTNIYSNANVSNDYLQFGGLIGIVSDGSKNTTSCTISNCWYEGNIYSRNANASQNLRIGGFVGYVMHGRVVIQNSLFSGDINFISTAKGGNYVGGFVADSNALSNVPQIDIIDSLSAGTITLAADVTYNYVGSVVGRSNGGLVGIDNVYATTDCYSETHGRTTSHYLVTDATQTTENSLIGLSPYHITNLDFTNKWRARENALPVPTPLADSGYTITEDETKADTTWYTEAEEGTTTYYIADAADLYGLAILVNDGNTFEGKTIQLTANIDLNPEWDGAIEIVDGGPVAPDEPTNEWIPIGTASNPFKGNFNGNQKTISGLYIDKRVADSNGAGLFGNTHNAADETQICTISNFALTNSYIYANNTDYVGSIVGSGEGSVSNVYSSVGIYGVNNANNGGIIGYVPHDTSDPYVCTISNCWYDGLYVLRTGSSSADQYVNAGGLVGCTMGGDTTIEHCLFTGIFNYKTGFTGNSTYEDYPVWPRMGGLVGRNNGTTSAVAIIDSVSAGSITAIASGENATISQVGSIIGSERSATSNASSALCISNVYAMSNYNLPVAMGKESSGVTVDVTSFIDTDGETITIVNVKDDWATGIEQLNETYWTMSITIPVLKSLVDYAGRELPGQAWKNLVHYFNVSSLIATTDLVTQIPVPEIAVPEYTQENPDTEGNYYGTGTGMQGGYFDGRYYYQSFVKYCYNDNGNYSSYHNVNNAKNIVVIVKYDVIARKVVATSEEIDNLNHVNDITYNSKTGQLVVCNSTPNTKTISYLDAETLEYVDQIKYTEDFYAIEYHAGTDQYIVGIGGTNQFAIANAELTSFSQYLGGIATAAEYTKQTLCCDDNYVYCLYYGNGTYHDTDAIMVYDWAGNLVTTIEVDFGDQEPENISVVDGALFVGTGKSNKAYFYNISDLKVAE